MAEKIGRNDPCPCGSGLKFKKCCIDKNDRFNTQAAPTNDRAAGGGGGGSPEPKRESGRVRERVPEASPFLRPLADFAGGSGGKFNDEFYNEFDDKFNDELDDNLDEDLDKVFGDDDDGLYDGAAENPFAGVMRAMRGKQPEDLFKFLDELGLPVTKEIMIEDAARVDSVYELCDAWQKRYRPMKNGTEETLMWEAAQVLWEKLNPAGTPCLEIIFDKIQAGYKCPEDDDAALEIWTEAWEGLKASLGRISRTFEQVDEQIAVPDGGLEEWAGDLCRLLAGLIEERGHDYKTRLEKFAAEFMAAFPDASKTLAIHARIAIAEMLFHKGKTAEADARFEALAAEYPRCHDVYEHWAAAYCGKIFDKSNKLPPDYEKALAIATRGASIEGIDGRGDIMETVRQINRTLFREKRLNAVEREAARAAYEFESNLSKRTLQEQLDALDELCLERNLRSFERFVEPVHLYKTTIPRLAGAGMIDEALGLVAIFYMRQPELYKENYKPFDRFMALAAIAKGDFDSAESLVEKFIAADSPDYASIESIIRFAVICGMEKRFAAHCDRAARNFFKFESGRRGGVGADLKFLAASAIFEETFEKWKNGEPINEKALSEKLFMTGSIYDPEVPAGLFAQEIGPCGSPALLGGRLRGALIGAELYDTLFRMSFHYFMRMREEFSRGFVLSSIIWGFAIEAISERMERTHADSGFDKICQFSRNELKNFAFEGCSGFGDESDRLAEIAAGLKGMRSVFEFLRDAGVIEGDTCADACAAAEWTLAKLLERFKGRSWQLCFLDEMQG